MTFKDHRQKVQKVSLVMSTLIFAIAAYGIFTHNDNLFIAGLMFIGFVLLGSILLAPVLGRFWCGWLCPRGIFLDKAVGPLSWNRKIPGFFRSRGFRNMMVGVLVLMLGMTVMGMNPLLESDNPLANLGGFLVFMCIVTTIGLSVPLGIVFRPRTWCSFCPVGYIQSLMSAKRMLKLKVEGCTECRRCDQMCPMELNASSNSTDCFNCLQCVDVCKKQSVTPVISLEPQ